LNASKHIGGDFSFSFPFFPLLFFFPPVEQRVPSITKEKKENNSPATEIPNS
jgi:hypothetical protein